jgi:hypothetical protein
VDEVTTAFLTVYAALADHDGPETFRSYLRSLYWLFTQETHHHMSIIAMTIISGTLAVDTEARQFDRNTQTELIESLLDLFDKMIDPV